MSRKIKFRVWDTDANDWLHDCSLKETVFGCRSGYHKSDSDGFAVLYPNGDHREYNIEQYTGLKDKNGKEIYEGDIVALLFGYVPMKSVTTENIRIENAQKAVIHFDTARAAFRYTIKLRTPKDCQFKPGTTTNMVVIGNIHENPELLEDKE